jgi:PAS domain S-box-containing protein
MTSGGAPPPAAAVLVVDDDPAARLAFRAMLAPLGHVIVEAASGRAAVDEAVQQTFAVIILDVRMPTLDGYETAKLIRQRSQARLTPIIFVTAFGRDETETATAYASGAVDFIFRPILADVLRAKVSAFVELFLQSQELQRSLESITALNVALRDSEVRARALLQNVADGIVTVGEDGLIESLNRSAQRLFDYRESEVVGEPLQFIIAPSHHADFADPVRARWSLPEIAPEPIESVGRRKDGSHFPMEMDVSGMHIGERMVMIACIRDISDRKAYTEALEHRTLHDDLTGLPNRSLFGDRMNQAIASADRADESRGVLLVDVDESPEVNGASSRKKSDALVQAVAERLCDAVGWLTAMPWAFTPASA